MPAHGGDRKAMVGVKWASADKTRQDSSTAKNKKAQDSSQEGINQQTPCAVSVLDWSKSQTLIQHCYSTGTTLRGLRESVNQPGDDTRTCQV